MHIMRKESFERLFGKLPDELPNMHDGANGESAENPSFRRGGVGAAVVDTSTQQWALHDARVKNFTKGGIK